MKIPVTKESMAALKPGDKVFFRCRGEATVKGAFKNQVGIVLWYEEYPGDHKYMKEGGSYTDKLLDIIAIEPTMEIPEGSIPWTLPNTIYAYRLNPKKQEGELWVVIRQMSEKLPIELSLCPTKEQAIHKGKSFVDSYKVLAIKATGIIWQEGDGLELMEEGE